MLLLVVWASGAAAIIIGLVGSYGLGAYIAAQVLPAAMAFVLIGLVSPGLFRRPPGVRLRPATTAPPAPASAAGSAAAAGPGADRHDGGDARSVSPASAQSAPSAQPSIPERVAPRRTADPRACRARRLGRDDLQGRTAP